MSSSALIITADGKNDPFLDSIALLNQKIPVSENKKGKYT